MLLLILLGGEIEQSRSGARKSFLKCRCATYFNINQRKMGCWTRRDAHNMDHLSCIYVQQMLEVQQQNKLNTHTYVIPHHVSFIPNAKQRRNSYMHFLHLRESRFMQQSLDSASVPHKKVNSVPSLPSGPCLTNPT